MRMQDSALRRIGVLGGTFDPLHTAHLIAASEASYAFSLDRVMFVPTGQPWQKSVYSDAEDRYMMTLLGAASDPRFAVSRMELDRRGPTYTADTMQELRDFHGPNTELVFIGGTDAIRKLGTWHGVERLAELAEVVCVTRPGAEGDEIEQRPEWPKVHVLEIPAIDISATDIRRRVRTGRPIDFLVPAAVQAYIRERGLYV